MSDGDVFQVKMKGSLGGFPQSNVFWYRQSSGGAATDAAAALANLFDQTVLEAVCALQSTSSLWTQVEVVNYAQPSDFSFFTPENDAGVVAGATSPNYVAFGYRLNRIAPGQRSGYKRFSAPVDAVVVGNTWTPPTPQRDTLTNRLQAVLTAGDFDWEPVIVKHSDKSDPTYKIELGTNPVVQFRFLTATPLTVIRSQVSRRRPNVN